MHASINTLTPSTARKPRVLKWRVVDIVVASVIGVASGVIFWAWGLAWSPLSALLAFTPGLEGLLAGGWLFAGVLGGLIIRKPGAAIYTEVIAAVVSMLIGTQWGFSTLIWGIVEGLGAEIVLALFLYANWRLGVALLAGAGAGVAVGLLDTTFTSYAALDFGYKAVYFVSAVVSGIVLAGLLSWLAVRGLARTGALARFAAGRETGQVDLAVPQPTR
ncbi:ECF transporter S component [Cryobacterium sp. SO2]|uniref:ECF transporter S component n=1 Tax=Cryobacterium sp. SO2 TaxID=1897060 RepID=UPI00223E00F3|nr:ECF transporter S component [Cryobacterium sp. SO2]WEO75864.1 ECF transporter S component [Cryobacterium sp. SO2]